MNKKLFLTALPAAAALLAGCSKTEVIPAESAPQEITFQTVETKAASSFAEANKFYSYAYFLEKGKNWAANSADGQAYISGSLIEYNSTDKAWKNASTKYYWPKQGSLTFFAWSDNTSDPAIATGGGTLSCGVGTGIAVAGYDITKNLNKDLLVAEIKADQTENTVSYTGSPSGNTWAKGVPTVFKHVLSDLVFKVNTDYATSNDPYTGVTFKLKSITLKNVSTKGGYEQGSPTASTAPWSGHSDAGTLRAYSNAEIEVTHSTTTAQTVSPATDDYHIVLPQTFASVTTIDSASTPLIEVVYTITTEYVTGYPVTETVTAIQSLDKIYTAGWEPGKRYTLTILLGLNEILWDPDVTDWTAGTTGEFNI